MKKLCVLLSLGFLFACEEGIDELPEVIVEEVASASIAEETEVEEIEILLDVLLDPEAIEIREVVIEEEVEATGQKIEVNLNAIIEEVQVLEIIEVPETEIEIEEIPRKN
ncbi:MAG: hypothetical protein HEP71_24270 [Roseivirga sp.]|nr:hypothetical protein [Roseivirga sp.]